jgi:hypothetical protein
MSDKERTHNHLGKFKDCALTAQMADAILAYCVRPDDIAASRAFFATKWWDYRFVHPGFCYLYFADVYGRAIDRWRSKWGLSPDAVLKLGSGPVHYQHMARYSATCSVAITLPNDKAYRTGLWRSMCIADAHGIPYDFWIEHAFIHFFEQRKHRLPTPSVLASNDASFAVIEKWRERERALLFEIYDPAYRVLQHPHHPWQDGLQDWLLDLIAHRPNPMRPLGHYLAKDPLISIHKAIAKFGEDFVRDAFSLVRDD